MSAVISEGRYERLVGMLGKPLSRDSLDRVISELSSDLNEEPAEVLGRTSNSYDFYESGLALDFEKEPGFFNQLCLSVFTAIIEAGNANPYVGHLPFGIKTDDSRDEIEKKLPSSSTLISGDEFSVEVWPLRFGISFRSPVSGAEKQRLSMVSVLYLPNSSLPPSFD